MTKKKNPADLKKSQPKHEELPFTPDPPKAAKPEVKKAAPKKAAAPKAKPTPKVETKATVTVEKKGPKPSPEQAAKEAGYRFDLLDNWMGLNEVMGNMGEAESFALLEHERGNKQRPAILMRLHGRFNKLRGQREKLEMMQGAMG